jgi:hypothetical protein
MLLELRRELARASPRRLERSGRHCNVSRASSPPSRQRPHQRRAVADETLKADAAAFRLIPSSIASTSATRPAGPNLALRWNLIRALLGGESWQTTASREGPDAL